MAYILRPSFPLFFPPTSVSESLASSPSAAALARLDALSFSERCEFWRALQMKANDFPGLSRFQDSGSEVFVTGRRDVSNRPSGSDASHKRIFEVAGSQKAVPLGSSLPFVRRGAIGWRTIALPKAAPQPVSDAILERISPINDQAILRQYALAIVAAVREGDNIDFGVVRSAYRVLLETDVTQVLLNPLLPEGLRSLADTDVLSNAVSYFSRPELFPPVEDGDDSEALQRVPRLADFLIRELEGASEQDIVERLVTLARTEVMKAETAFREYVLKVAAVHLIRLSNAENQASFRKLLTEIRQKLNISEEDSIRLSNIPEEVVSVLSWLRLFAPEGHPAILFFQNSDLSENSGPLGSVVLNLPSHLLKGRIGQAAVVAQDIMKSYPELNNLKEVTEGLPIFLFESGTEQLKRVDIRLGRVWQFGRGGMGALYLVERLREPGSSLQPLLLVAKTIFQDPERSDSLYQEMVKQFLREAAIGEILGGHPNILSVQQVAWVGPNQPVIFMRYLRPWTKRSPSGKQVAINTVLDLISQGGELDLGFVLSRILLPVGRSIAHAHQQGVVHGDLKPDNILMELREKLPQAVVADWGSAESIEVGSSGKPFSGTPAYFFRKDYNGAVRDVRALAMILYQILGRKHPVHTTKDYARVPVGTLMLMAVDWPSQVKPLHELWPEIPPELERIIVRGMGYSPAEQATQFKVPREEAGLPYKSMSEFVDALESFYKVYQARLAVSQRLSSAENHFREAQDPQKFPQGSMTRKQFDSYRELLLSARREYEFALSQLGRLDLKVLADHAALLWRLYEEAERFGLEWEVEPLLSRYPELVDRTQQPITITLSVHGVEAARVKVDLVRLHLGADKTFAEEPVFSGASLEAANLHQPKGVYYLRLRAEGYVPMQIPVTLRRGQTSTLSVRLFREDEIPKGFAAIPGGELIVEEYPDSYRMRTDRVETVEPFLVSQTMVTNAQYIEFLNVLIANGKHAEALSHVPATQSGVPLWDQKTLDDIRSGTAIPQQIHFSDNDPVLATAPVIWLHSGSTLAYLQWKSSTASGQTFRLPTSKEMFYLMRGTDARARPWGDGVDDAGLANVKGVEWGVEAKEKAHVVDVVPFGKFPQDVSPVSHPDRPVFDPFGNARKLTGDTSRSQFRFVIGAGYNLRVGSMAETHLSHEGTNLGCGFFVVCDLDGQK